MNSTVISAIVCGIDARLIEIQADISDGLPVFEMVGLLSSEVKEAKERVRTALKNSGYKLPARHITVNMSPANIRKSGSGFDLPVAIAILIAQEILAGDFFKSSMVIGEIGLRGNVIPVDGVLPVALRAVEEGYRRLIVPAVNVGEASLAGDIEIIGVSNLEELVAISKGELKYELPKKKQEALSNLEVDFSEVNGQKVLRRACEVAVSGMHNFLMIGPPGAGKSMIAKRLPTILPPLSQEERIELSKIYSVCGYFTGENGGRLMDKRPFRSPHHTISPVGLSGGGCRIKPGEVSLAHRGVLFLDELPEFSKTSLEILRQPMEDSKISICRANGNCTFPADFLLAAAMNPCKCGYYPDRNRCRCSVQSISNYHSRISQPLLDRIDITVEAMTLRYEELTSREYNESSADIRARVARVHSIQKKRYEQESFMFNSSIPVGKIEQYCKLNKECQEYIGRKYSKLELTARTYHKVIKVARTIADLDGAEDIQKKHLIEAISYRGPSHSYWEG